MSACELALPITNRACGASLSHPLAPYVSKTKHSTQTPFATKDKDWERIANRACKPAPLPRSMSIGNKIEPPIANEACGGVSDLILSASAAYTSASAVTSNSIPCESCPPISDSSGRSFVPLLAICQDWSVRLHGDTVALRNLRAARGSVRGGCG